MSFDLLAEFGGLSTVTEEKTSEPSACSSAVNDISFFAGASSTTKQPIVSKKDDDIWETFSNLATSSPRMQMQPPPNTFNHVPAITIIHGPQNPSGINVTPHIKVRGARDANVLFDADDQSDEDDFGDFETGTPVQISQPSTVSQIGVRGRPPNIGTGAPVSLDVISSQYPQAPKSPSFRERNPFADMKVITPVHDLSMASVATDKNRSPVTAWPTYENKPVARDPYMDSPAIAQDEDEWGAFTDLPGESPIQQPLTPNIAQINTSKQSHTLAASQGSSQLNEPPPSNIPPPSILLSIFPHLFDLPQSSLFQAVSNQSFSLKNRVLSDPSTIHFLRAYILIATVAARIVAGRKLRWKRDMHLAQSMSISTAGGKGGMKLAGVDKTESLRETREAAEVVRVWKAQVGKLKSIVATTNASLPQGVPHLIVPELAENVPIRAATTAEGAISDAKACIICGLKRYERMIKVDVQVEDSFGEFWVDHWGHRACKNFWQAHETQLRSR